MLSTRKIPADFIGIYIALAQGQRNEVAMSDSVRFKGTCSNISFAEMPSGVNLRFEGLFEERPVTITTKHVRVNIYINLKHARSVVSRLGEIVGIGLLQKEELPKAPDPRSFVVGPTAIPRRDIPSTQLTAQEGNINTPKWKISRKGIRVFLDIEEDKEFDRTQLHAGFSGFRIQDCQFRHQYPKIRGIELCSGVFSFSRRDAQVFRSYVFHYGLTSF